MVGSGFAMEVSTSKEHASAPRQRRWLGLVVVIVLASSPASAAVFVVNDDSDTSDSVPGDGTCANAESRCTLRAAIDEANALAGADEISLPAGRFRISGGRIAITDDLDVVGAGIDATRIQGKGQMTPSGFTVEDPSSSVAFSQMTIRRCVNLDDGGAFINRGTLSLTDIVLDRNRARDPSGLHRYLGGAIYNEGTLLIERAALTRNRAARSGGAIFNAAGTVVLRDVTIAHNRGRDGSGGGISNGGVLEAVNVTLTRNRARSAGGGLLNSSSGEVTLTNVTLVKNRTVGAARNIENFLGGPIELVNTLVDGRNSCRGQITSLGHNLDSEATCGFDSIADLQDVKARTGRFGDHGGVGRTVPLESDSPAVDAGDPGVCPAADQRGVARPQGAGCDIGAFELQP